WSENGSTARAANSSIPIPTDDADATGRMAVAAHLDVDRDGDTRTTFYTAPTLAGPWTAFGAPIDAEGTTSIFAGSAELAVGAFSGGTQENFAGVLHAAEVRSGDADGTVVAAPDFSAQAGGTTSFADSAGRTWTVHGDAEVYGVQTESITPSLDGEVWMKSIRYPGLNRPLFRVLDQGDDIAHPDRGSVYEVTGRAAPISVEDVQGSRRFTLLIQAESDSQAAALEIMFRVGGVLFVHVPPDKPVPGGYVHVGQVRRQRPTTLVRHRFVVPCTVVARPAPDVVGTTLTVGQLIAEHDSIES